VAQDFEKTGPKVPEAQPSQNTLPAAAAPTVQESETQLVASVKALVFVESSAAVKSGGASGSGLVTNGIGLLEKPGFKKLAEPYLGQPMTLGKLNTFVRDIVVYYRENDRPVVDVIVPEQDVTNGVIQIVVLEGKAGTIKAEGNRWFSDKSIEGQVRLKQHDPIRAKKLLQDINWINQNPFRTVDVVFAPGKQLGETDVTLRTQDRFPVRVYAGYEDSGNDLTGDERWFTGFNWGNAFGLDHQLSYQFTTSSDVEGLVAHSVSYLAPLPWRHKLLVFGSLSESQVEVPPFELEGSGAQIGARYTVPLPTINWHDKVTYEHEIILVGYDWKQSSNTLEFGVINASDTTTDTGQWVFGYRSGLRDPWGSWNFQAEVFTSPTNWWDRQEDDVYRQVRAGADAGYTYSQIQFGRTTRLPWNFTLSNQFTFQFSDSNLLPSEQLGVGGYNSVRGYDERFVSDADEGWIMRNELRTPPVKLLGNLFSCPQLQDQFQLVGFWDYAVANPHDPLPGEVDDTELSGAGAGIRYSISQYLSVRADYGFQLLDVDHLISDQPSRHDGRWHIGIVCSY
jgi:hemolysin activation/secretion protein